MENVKNAWIVWQELQMKHFIIILFQTRIFTYA